MSSTTLDDYSATLSIPQKVKVNEEFTIKAELKKELEQKVTISSKQQMFVYVIKDRNGKQINSYAITDKGKNREVSGKVVISENYKYKIKQPGIYEISAIAEFTVIKDGKSQNFKIEASRNRIINTNPCGASYGTSFLFRAAAPAYIVYPVSELGLFCLIAFGRSCTL